MADTQSSIFNKRATERLRSPDDLDRYVRITNPGVWAILIAIAALLVGLLAWGCFGAVTTNVTTTGASVGGQTVCFLTGDEVANVTEGDSATVGGAPMTVASIGKVPLSKDEAREVLGSDYLVSVLFEGDWAYLARFDGEADLEEGVPLQVNIVTERIAPITLVFGRSGSE